VHSEGTGRGATFTITLPTTTSSLSPAPSPAQPAYDEKAAAARQATKTILLVEDHADTGRSLQRLLQMAGYEVVVATTLAAGRDLASGTRFDLIISDIGLPDGSGLDLLKGLHVGNEPSRRVPAIALSGYGMKADISDSQAAGFAEHLTKPVDWEQLREVVRRLLC
jgi:CheY-like chemotaxis protein